MRSKAKRLIDEGVAGLCVLPQRSGERRVVLLDRDSLQLLKQLRDARAMLGTKTFGTASDEDTLSALDSVLETCYPQSCVAAGAPPSETGAEATALCGDSTRISGQSEESAKITGIIQKLRDAKARRRAAIASSNAPVL